MCGIAGVRTGRAGQNALRELIGDMTRRLAHRGPDSEGVWLDVMNGIALGHRRLAIIDPSPAGRQPMMSRCGRYVITYNGEIYNYQELRRELPAGVASSSSDTEVLLDCLSARGIDATLARLNGMFAFGLWDRLTQSLVLVTDRLGEKPMYHATIGRDVVFASELKALEAHAAFDGEMDDVALSLYLRTGYVAAPHSIYKGVFRLEPGTIATYRRGSAAPDVRRYWSPPAPNTAHTRYDNQDAAVEQLDELLSDSVRLRLRSDVPLGVFFSGGIDSTAVLARARRATSGRLTAFTVAFDEADYNEAAHARRLAERLDCDHVEATLTFADALAIIPELPSIYDEPFGDASGVATHLLAKTTSRQVTVALAGDGGDELFGGYRRYHWAQSLWPFWRGGQGPVRRATLRACGAAASAARSLRSRRPSVSRIATRLDRITGCLAARDTVELNEQLTAQTDAIGFLTGPEPLVLRPQMLAGSRGELLEQLMWLDVTDYLPNDLLVKVDRATMAVGLEARMPFLDHRLVEWALSLPVDLRLRGTVGKWILKQLLYREIPRRLIDRPKQGFALPIAGWLRGPLRDWSEDLLNLDRLRDQPLINGAVARAQWREHLAGVRDWRHSLWPLLVFLAWDRSARERRIRRAWRDAATSFLPAVAVH
jgi:asparagine synthase (glutamine-hydrolysing)